MAIVLCRSSKGLAIRRILTLRPEIFVLLNIIVLNASIEGKWMDVVHPLNTKTRFYYSVRKKIMETTRIVDKQSKSFNPEEARHTIAVVALS